MLALSDDEIVDFIASGSVRAFAILCMRKLPWLAQCGLQAHGDVDLALERAGQVMLRVWQQAPTFPARVPRVDCRLMDMLDTGPGGAAPLGLSTGLITDEHLADLLRRLLQECAALPQRPQGLLSRLFG